MTAAQETGHSSRSRNTTALPLAGLRVLDLTRVLAGPWATQLLGDYGADVIKVERPGSGDDTRNWGPPWLSDRNGSQTGESAYFLSANRNKRSITIDLSHPSGQRIVRELVAKSDVLIENFRAGSLARYGLDQESLRSAFPGLIYCSITAYGQHGSRAAEPGYDAMMQASAGLMSITGAPDEEDGVPQKVGVAVSDIMAGMYATTAILAALHAREKTGHGQYIDVPLYDSQVAWLANQGMNYLVSGEVPRRLGTGHPNLVPYQAFETSDGFLMLAVGNNRQFRSCVECLGSAELADAEKFSTNASRVENRRELIAIIADAFRRRSTAEWLQDLRRKRVPAGPINDLGEVFTGPEVAEAQLVRHLPHPLADSVPTIANPVRFSQTPVDYRAAPPLLGEHTRTLLREDLGYTDAAIDELQESGAI
ncbi:MAG TPA: CaiB/BaiF CoA-transferase family protein [Woeseiaceae bacterium]|nr:CaiB/BaiF CoA-transferase family protein [Woeseiaceae bacterium]